jgi:hypothetical protein
MFLTFLINVENIEFTDLELINWFSKLVFFN